MVTALREYSCAWQTWRQGHPAAERPLWRHSVLYWGRIGKLVEFLAALSILLEIIGPHAIHTFGLTLQHNGVVAFIRSHGLGGKFTDTISPGNLFGSLLGYSIALGLGFLGLRWLRPRVVAAVNTVRTSRGLGEVSDVVYYVNLVIILLIPITIWLVGAVGTVLVYASTGTAWLLELEDIVDLVKLASVVLLVLGFHFDLLAS